jgi:hypothetical protein
MCTGFRVCSILTKIGIVQYINELPLPPTTSINFDKNALRGFRVVHGGIHTGR